MDESRFLRFFLIFPSLLILYFVFQIFQPFIMSIFLATVLACLTFPIYSWLAGKLGGRQNLAALLMCLAVTALIIVPFVIVLTQLAIQATQTYQQLQAAISRGDLQSSMDFRELPYIGQIVRKLEKTLALDWAAFVGSLASLVQHVSLFFLRQSHSVISSLTHFSTVVFFMIFTMFFLFRDGQRLVAQLQSWTPLSENYESRIMERFRDVSSATVVGSLVTSLAQGATGGISLWLVGIPNVLLWSTLTALFSLVPLVGTAIVWAPWALYLFAIGSWWRGSILVILSIVLVGSIDNVLKPWLIEGKAKMHTVLVFFSILGGISYFGIVGMIAGPIVVALGLTFLDLYKIEFQQELSKRDPQCTHPDDE
jgi:predicted PurR-regulated permease PerM